MNFWQVKGKLEVKKSHYKELHGDSLNDFLEFKFSVREFFFFL